MKIQTIRFLFAASGPKGALVFMQWLGLDLLTKKGKRDNEAAEESEGGEWLLPPSPLFPQVPSPETQLNALLNGYEEFEELIGYR